MKKTKSVHIGTSGWHYGHWDGPFYPDGMAKKDYLSYYARHFHTAEVNNTFYQVPPTKTFEHWKKTVPLHFLFAVKASRYITHMKKLKDPEKPVSKFLKRVEVLGDKLGPVLFQLPPRWRVNAERLETFLEILPSGFRYAFEFRDPSWFHPRVLELLKEKKAAFCIYDFDRHQSPKEVTAEFVYIRLHGPEGPYKGKYDSTALSGWAGAISSWARGKREIYCYFDNDQSGYAPQDAQALNQMLAKD